MVNGLSIEPDRVRRNTSARVNRRIDTTTLSNIGHYAGQPREAIDRRIRQLNSEWDLERTLEANAAAFGLTGLALAASVNRRWMLLTGTVLGFLLLHAVQGWCPPVPVLRRAGVRTRTEIDREKLALKYLRGDFGAVEQRPRPIRERRRLGALVG